jgi:two-component system, LytTR family, response regulator
MPPVKILIADDEREARELLLHYLKDWSNQVIIDQCADGKTTLEYLIKFQPDILFLDIKMPELSGIEVMQQKQITNPLAVIFTTAYDEYALPAFDFEAVDYLLKPFEKERFNKAMKKAMDYVDFIRIKKSRSFIDHLAVKTGSRTDRIPVNEIYYFQAEGSYVQVVSEKKTQLITEPIYELESILNPEMFLRIHRSFIVNIKFIQSIQSLLNGDHILFLKTGKEIRASRTYRENINSLKKRAGLAK